MVASSGNGEPCTQWPGCDHRDGDDIGEILGVPAADPDCVGRGFRRDRVVPRSDEGTGTGSATGARATMHRNRWTHRRDGCNLRRRHSPRGPAHRAGASTSDHHESRHAARINPRQPETVDAAAQNAALRGHRRGARVPRGVRRACGDGATSTATRGRGKRGQYGPTERQHIVL